MNRGLPRTLSLSLLTAATWATLAGPAEADYKQERRVRMAREAYLELLHTRDRKVPERLLENSRCVAVIPDVIKGAFWVGGRHGKGVVSCRDDAGEWSPPLFLELTGGSIGVQFGGESTDLVLFFMTERSARSLLKSKFTLGADATVAAGPIGRSAEAMTDAHFNAEILSYAKSKGVFAGIALEGGRLAPDQKATQRYYGERLWPDEILFDHRVPGLPEGAQEFMDSLP